MAEIVIRPRLLDRPIIILGCNRSGTTLLFNTISRHPMTWSLYVESQDLFYRHYPIHDQQGDRLAAGPDPVVAQTIEQDFFSIAHNKEAFKDRPILRHIPRKLLQRPFNRIYKRAPVRLVEKTPANSLRVPMLVELFPDARFILLVRRGESVVSSLMEGWKNWSGIGSGPFTFTRWHYLVPPGWQAYRERPLAEICAYQWSESTRIAWEDLNRVRGGRFLLLKHEELVADPVAWYSRILEFCELPTSHYFDWEVSQLPRRIYTTGGSAPRKDKWKELHGPEIEAVHHLLSPVNALFYTD
jgi:hypothetical protein